MSSLAAGQYEHFPELEGASSNPKKSQFFTHLKVLLRKQYLTQARSKKSILCICLSPVLLSLILYLIQLTVSIGLKYENPEPAITPAGEFQRCKPLKGFDSCISIGYAIFGQESSPWVEHTLDFIAKNTGLERGKDIQEVYRGENYTEFNQYFIDHPGVTKIGLLFCTATNLPINSTLPLPKSCQSMTDPTVFPPKTYKLTPYLIVYNHSLISSDYQTNPQLPFPTYPTALQLKILVDNAIIDYYGDKSGKETINVMTQGFPQTEFRFFEGFDIVDQQGGIYFFIAPIITFIVLLNEITTEKEKRLRQGLSVVGVSHFTYWLHWIILAIFYAVIVAVSVLISGHAFGFKVFTKCPILIHFMLFFFFTLAMEFFALFVYTLVPTVKVANTVGYGILLLGIVMQLFLSQPIITEYLYDTTNSWGYKLILDIFLVYPAFSFTTIYTDIMQLAGDTYSPSQAMWVTGPGYFWSDFVKKHTGKTMSGFPFEYPSSLVFLMYLIMDCAIFAIFSFYTDHVVAHNRGSGSSAYFFLEKNYWSCLKSQRKRKVAVEEAGSESDVAEGSLDTVLKEKEKVVRHIEQDREARGIRIADLSKVYRTGMCGRRSKNDVKALNHIYLEVGEGELLGLLGHNGAGKTTLINILTGVLGGFEGQITIAGFDIVEDKDDVKKVVGVCPQFDILWYELTAKEHLRMFAEIKGIPKENIEKEIAYGLEQVNLTKVGDVWAGTFSGGMKRRLSMAIAGIGDPKIIFLDEPTTGMDPKNRRQVWELIKNLKKNRVVILTTHAMEEADALSDRIAVIVDGRFKCIGNSLFLKNNFGDGYRLTVIADPENANVVKQLMKQKIPSVKVIDESGGSLMFSVPSEKTKELQAFFRVIENKDDDPIANQLRELTHDWGLSNTTLEEVFMKVTGKKEKKLE